MARRRKEFIRGGLASGRRQKVSATALRKGTAVEIEHVVRRGRKPTAKDRAIAREIAMDHLVESPRYYDELAKMEKRLERRNAGGSPSAATVGVAIAAAIGVLWLLRR